MLKWGIFNEKQRPFVLFHMDKMKEYLKFLQTYMLDIIL